MSQDPSPRLCAYLALEREMRALDDLGDEGGADMLREAMDPLWYALSDDERAWLNARAESQTAARRP